ncbi:MAG: hypothetical protein JOZ15_09785 [Acidobacteria bacterium]|nr:hypothetical protein [Acidobacteriota bacterium]
MGLLDAAGGVSSRPSRRQALRCRLQVIRCSKPPERRPDMSNRILFNAKSLQGFGGAVGALAIGCLLAAAIAAPAATIEGGEGGGGFAARGAATAARPAGTVRQAHPVAAARLLPSAVEHTISRQPTPNDASTGLFIEGGIGFRYGSGMADLTAAIIANQRAGGTSGDLTLHLIATTSVPAGSFTYFDLASADLGTLDAGTEFDGLDTGELSFVPPSNGCYYASLLLLEDGNFADVRTFSTGVRTALENNGYALFPFGGAPACSPPTSCTRTSNGACVVGSRFQVTAIFDNAQTGAGTGQVLSFGGSRAESDESVFYYFTDPSNFELGVKVLDACSFSSNFWIFIGGLTNQWWSVNVLDTLTGNRKSYFNPIGTTTVTVTDTAALPCP